MVKSNKIVSIVGLTSSGKSGLSLELAMLFDGEIVSADSRQIYKGMDWCTGKVTKEEMHMVPHYLIDILETNELYSLSQFQADAYKAIDDILARGKLPFLVGGTGLYVRSVVKGFNMSEAGYNQQNRDALLAMSREQLLARLQALGVCNIDPQKSNRHLVRMIEKAMVGDKQEKPNKPKYNVLQIGIKWPRAQIYKRIEQRLDDRLPHILSEVENLLKTGTTTEFLERMGLEAKMAYWYLQGKYASYEQFREELLKEERHFAKRQDTWFKKDTETIWLDGNSDYIKQAKKLIQDFLEK